MKTSPTPVEWFYDQIKSHFEHDDDLFEKVTFAMVIAKKREQRQIEAAIEDGYFGCCNKKTKVKIK